MTAQQLRIRSLGDLIAKLGSPDMQVRVKVLQAISAAPDKALAFGKRDGRDILDTLLGHLSDQKEGSITWRALAATVAAFDDPRTVGVFRRVFAEAKRPDSIFLAAGRIARDPSADWRAFLVEQLLRNESQARAETAASLLSRLDGHDQTTQVRLTLLRQVRKKAPAPDGTTVFIWLVELDGLFFRDARRCLEGYGEAAFDALLPHWDRLSADNKGWLSRWSQALSPDRLEALLRRSLAESDEDAVPDAFGLLGDPDGQVRAAVQDALITLGKTAIAPAQAAMEQDDERLWDGAARVLLALGQGAWLEQWAAEAGGPDVQGPGAAMRS